MEPITDEFRAFCMDQVHRLSQFRQFQFMNATAHRDYRKWLERKCGSRKRVERLMDSAIELEAMPTIADLNRLAEELFDGSKEPQLSLEERQARAEYLRDWYAQEAREAEQRRAELRAKKTVKPSARPVVQKLPPLFKPITYADVRAALATRKATSKGKS